MDVHFTLTDAHHNPVSGARFLLRAPKGEPGAVVTEAADGTYQLTYTPPDVTAPETVQLEVAVENGLLVPAPPLRVTPRLEGYAFSAGLSLSLHSNQGLASGATPGAELDVRLPNLPVEVVLRADHTFYQSLDRTLIALPVSHQLVTYGSSGLMLGARAEGRIQSWVGLHAAAALVGQRVDAAFRVTGGPADGAAETSTALCAGVEGAAGVTYRVGSARVFIEALYALVPAQGVLRGNLGGWGARGGVLLEAP
jgi:hypothetical protein